MKKSLPWFPCYPDKLLGALAGMKAPLGYVYVVALLRIYESGGCCSDSADSLATRTKLNRRVVSEALDTLYRSGRLLSTPQGMRNPVADEVLAVAISLHEKRVSAGENGASKRWKKTEQKQYREDSKAIEVPMASDSYKQEQEQLFSRENRVSDWPSDYREQFWTNYPRRTEKKAAMAKLDAICKSAKVPWARFFGGVMRYAAQVSGTEERFIKHPTTWLNRGCWDDEYRPGPGGGGVTPSSGSRPRGGGGFAEVSRALRERRQGGRHDDGGTDGGADGRRTLPGTGGAGDGADR